MRWPAPFRVGGVTGAVVLALACGGNTPSQSPAPTPAPTPRVRPNLVVIVVDDLDVPTYLQLSRIRDVMASQGLSFTHAYAAQPLCAPSRASILTGQYTHNHQVFSNHAPDGGFPAFRRLEQSTIATWLKGAGYHTALVGKYINDYPRYASDDYVPPGWDDWYGHMSSLEDGRYFNYWVNDNHVVSRHGAAQEDYSPDAEAARAVQAIRSVAGQPEPLFLYVAPESPHDPAQYAVRHSSEFHGATMPRVPSFNESHVDDKPSWVRQMSYLTDAQIADGDAFQRNRLRSMRAVEDMVEGLMAALVETGRFQNSYVFLLSDNGLLMGQHRGINSKGCEYEECINIPLVVRGPGVPVGVVEAFVLNVDLPPTLLDLAGAPIPESVDGRSFAPFLRGTPPASWRSDVPIENYGIALSPSLRSADWFYNHQDTDEVELYDMRADPYQLHNLGRQSDPAFLDSFERRIATLLACRGASCRN
jgi:N-acetylglucosamine-6-sulfatase